MPRLGFIGKLPARGDFVRFLVARAVAENIEAWTARVLPAMQRDWGDAAARRWAAAAPLRFALAPPGWPDAVSGVWLPSRDAVGRQYPLVICLETAVAASGSLLDAAEAAGRLAIADAEPPGWLAERLAALQGDASVPDAGPGPAIRWWRGTEILHAAAHMPDAAAMCRMLQDEDPA